MVTIVLPAYNEEDIIEQSVSEWHDQIISKLPGSELLVVDDCSTDRTGLILAEIAARLPAVRVIRPERNGGHGRALRFGFAKVRSAYVFYTDSDRQHLPAEFWDLWKLREGHDFVFGMRESRADGGIRKANSLAMRIVILFLWGKWIKDANCPFKLMRRESLDYILSETPEDCFIPMVLVSILARRMKFRVAEAPVTHLPRNGGTPSLQGWGRLFRIAFMCTQQLVALRLRVERQLSFRNLPPMRAVGPSRKESSVNRSARQ